MNKFKKFSLLKAGIFFFIFICLITLIPFTQHLVINAVEHTIGRSLRSITKWSNVITHTAIFFLTIAISFYFLIYAKKGKEIASDIVSKFKEMFKNKRYAVGFIMLSAIIILISYASIILANYDYTDDIRRSFTGHKAWIGWTRIISESLAVFIHTNFYINDIWPLTHFISITILSFTAYILAYIVLSLSRNFEKTAPPHTFVLILSSLLFSITPYFAINMSFKFDCPYMSLSIFFAVLPFLWLNKQKTFAFMSFICLQFVCVSYQAANGIYIVLSIFTSLMLFVSEKSWKNIVSFSASAILAYAFSLLFFKAAIAIPRIWNDSATSPDAVSLYMIPKNIINYSKSVTMNFGNNWIRFFSILAVLLFPYATVSISKQKKSITFMLSILALILMFLFGAGAYLVFKTMLLNARAYMGFDILISLLVLLEICALKNKAMRRISYIIAACLFWGFCVSTISLGTFYHKYKEYTRFRFDALLMDLNEIVDSNAHNTLYINNGIELPESVHVLMKNYPIEKFKMTTNTMQFFIKGYNMDFEILNEDFIEEIQDKELIKKLTDLPLIKDTYYHTIYGKDNQYFVEFKNPEPQGD